MKHEREHGCIVLEQTRYYDHAGYSVEEEKKALLHKGKKE
jgi:uncharacterized protein YjbK